MINLKDNEVMSKVSWPASIWFSDIDDTLIDTAGTTVEASDGVRQVFESKFGLSTARSIQEGFNGIFDMMMAGYRVKNEKDWLDIPGGETGFKDLIHKIEFYQQDIIEKYGAIKKWSREVFIKIAADKIGLQVTPELIREAADAYWVLLTEKTEVFPGVVDLITEIKRHNRPLYLITSSDARLKMRDDGQFIYIPEESEVLKRERIELLRSKGINFDGLAIGDPEDKPHIDFSQKGIRLAESDLGKSLDPHNAIMIGDSFAGDLQTPKEKMGFGLVALFQKGRTDTNIEGNLVTTGNILEVVDYLRE